MEARNRIIEQWFNYIRSGQLLLPRFQRFEAWDYDNVTGVLEAVLTKPKSLPIGSTLVLEIGDKQPFVTRPLAGAPAPTERCTEHLLDGQQRLTALWKSLHDLYENQNFFVRVDNETTDSDGEKNSRVFRQKRWLHKDGRRFPVWADDPVQIFERGLAPISLIQPIDITKKRQAWCDAATKSDLNKSRDLENRLRDLQERVKSFNLPILSLPVGTAPATALDVFVKMNTSSVPLSPFDIVVAQFEEKNKKSLHDLVTDLRKTAPVAEDYISLDHLVLQVAALHGDQLPGQTSYLSLDLNKLDLDWEITKAGIYWATTILEEEGIFDSQRLPTITVIPVLAAIHKDMPSKLDDLGNARALIRAYLWRAFFTSRYENASATRALQDYRALRDTLKKSKPKSSVPIFNENNYPLPQSEELIQAGWPKRRETLARAILCVASKGGAFDIADARTLNRNDIKGREYHHLFPDSVLQKDAKLSEEDSFKALNCILITMHTNRNISAKDPLTYLKERIDKSDLGEGVIRDRLKSHGVPFDAINVGGYAEIQSEENRKTRIQSDYTNFLLARAALISNAVKSLCEGRNWPHET